MGGHFRRRQLAGGQQAARQRGMRVPPRGGEFRSAPSHAQEDRGWHGREQSRDDLAQRPGKVRAERAEMPDDPSSGRAVLVPEQRRAQGAYRVVVGIRRHGARDGQPLGRPRDARRRQQSRPRRDGNIDLAGRARH